MTPPPSRPLLLPVQFQSVSEMLRWRSQSQGETALYSLVDAKVGGGMREDYVGGGAKEECGWV